MKMATGDGNGTQIFNFSTTVKVSYFPDNATTGSRAVYTRRFNPPDPLVVGIYNFTYYCYPFLLTVGSISNVLAYFVFSHTRLRKVSSINYLAAVAVVDTGFLWTFFLTPLYGFYKVPIIVQDGVCQFMTFLNYIFTFLSVWYMVAVVVDTFIGVYWPLKKTTMCTPFRAKLVMSFMAVMSIACYSYIVYFFGPDTVHHVLRCMPWKELRIHFHNLSKIDTFVVALLPYIAIIVLTLLIVIRGCEYYRISATIELWPVRSGSTSSISSVRVTNILFPVIVLTVICNVPVMILRAVMTLGTVWNPSIAKWNQLFYILYIISFAVKFFVYVLFSRSFRRRTRELLKSGLIRAKEAFSRKNSPYRSHPQGIDLESMSRPLNVRAKLMESDI